ncbi:hypothetical protein AB0M22_45085 [Nocardia sp. NPDC051756]|uniref:hypothetical protein n=1 Tax=Nocardia sp. NPDC051756 TaxID=3154751 RepID=UPI003427E449
MDVKRCPRCGDLIEPAQGRGRPRRWCSPECRRRAFEENRAAASNGRVVEIHEEVRVVERSRPLSPDGAVERVLGDAIAIQKLLRVLAHRMYRDPGIADVGANVVRPLLHDLWLANHGVRADDPVPAPELPPEAAGSARKNRADAHREAVALVLDSPRSTREVLHALTEQARNGTLANAEHAPTVAAANGLLNALVASRTLRLR